MTGSSTERSFGLSLGLVCAAAAGFSAWGRHDGVAVTLAVTAAVLVVAGLLAPGALSVPQTAWRRLTQAVGWINIRIILVMFFVLVFTPVGILSRLFRRNPLGAPGPGTHWAAARHRDPRHYERLY